MQRFTSKIAYQLLMAAKASYQYIFPDRSVDKPVIFVAGVQRSGTNMVMDVLERSYETEVYHERSKKAFSNYEMLDSTIIRDLYRKSKGKHFVIKTLCELQRLNELMEQFPNSKVIWVFRHYDDSINSMLVSFKNQARQAKEVAEDRNGSQWRGQGMSDTTHKLVKDLVHDKLSNESGAAIFWYYRNILFFENHFPDNDRVMLISYEQMVQDPQNHFNTIFTFLDLKYTPRISKNVHSRSIRLREPREIDQNIRDQCNMLYKKLTQFTVK